MRRVLIVMLLAGGIAGGLVARAPVAWGCSCVTKSVEGHMDDAGYVFYGTATVIERDGRADVVATFALSEIFKGRLPRSVEVRTAPDEAACGFSFVAGSKYTVFAMAPGDEPLTTSLCSGTTDDTQVRARVRALAQRSGGAGFEGAGSVPGGSRGPAATPRGGPIAVAGLLAFVAGAGVVWRWRTDAS